MGYFNLYKPYPAGTIYDDAGILAYDPDKLRAIAESRSTNPDDLNSGVRYLSLDRITSGLTLVVSTNSTIEGDGSTKKLGVLWVYTKSSSYIDGGDADSDAEIRWIDADGNTYQPGDGAWSGIAKIEINQKAALASADPTSPVTPLGAVDNSDVLDRLVAGEFGRITLERDASNYAVFSIQTITKSGSTYTITVNQMVSESGNTGTNGSKVIVKLGINHNIVLPEQVSPDFVEALTAGYRTSLPISGVLTVDELSLDDEMLLANFKKTTARNTFKLHGKYHVGLNTITGLTYKAGNLTTAGQITWSAPIGGNTLVTIYPPAGKLTEIKNQIIKDTPFEVIKGSNFLEGNIQNDPSVLFGKISFNLTGAIISGSFSTGDAVKVDVNNRITDSRQVCVQVFKFSPINISGKGGTEGQVWLRGSSDSNAKWGAIPYPVNNFNATPIFASFRDRYATTFSETFNNNNANTSAISDGNQVPSGAPANTTDALLTNNYPSGVQVGDWFYANVGDDYIIAKIQHIETPVGGGMGFWFNPTKAEHQTLRYDQLGNGAGTVAFYVRSSGGSGETNVQSDWNETDTTDDSYIKNKPTIPAAQLQANWTETDSTSKAFIQNKPTITTPKDWVFVVKATSSQSTWADISSDTYADNDFVKITVGATVSGVHACNTMDNKFSEIPDSNGCSFSWNPSNGHRVRVRRNGNKLQSDTEGSPSNIKIQVWKWS